MSQDQVMRRHNWQYRDAEGDFKCLNCGAEGRPNSEGRMLDYGGLAIPYDKSVDLRFCVVEPEQPPLPELNINVVDAGDGDAIIPDAEARSDEVFHEMLVGSAGRVAIKFTKAVTFYTMEPNEAFDMAQHLLKAAYEARARQEGMITGKLGPYVKPDE